MYGQASGSYFWADHPNCWVGFREEGVIAAEMTSDNEYYRRRYRFDTRLAADTTWAIHWPRKIADWSLEYRDGTQSSLIEIDA
jgi:hypothetical protein